MSNTQVSGDSKDITKLPPIDETMKKNLSRVNTLIRKPVPKSYLKRPITNSAKDKNGSLTLEKLASKIRERKFNQIVVMSGAGLSTASGIPDFRTKGTGLYDNLAKYNVPYPEAIFDLDYFNRNPAPFFALAKELWPNGNYKPNRAHYFLRLLHNKGILLRVYTQNIDGLDKSAGLPPNRVVESHGTFATATCQSCEHQVKGDIVKPIVMQAKIPYCNSCHTGVLKPDIVFFGEDLPERFHLYRRDFSKCDLLLILGTSLKVQPFADIVSDTRFEVPRVLFNKFKVGPFAGRASRKNDVAVLGDISTELNKFAKLLGWFKELEKLEQTHQSNMRLKVLSAPPSKQDINNNTPFSNRPIQNKTFAKAKIITTSSVLKSSNKSHVRRKMPIAVESDSSSEDESESSSDSD